MRKFKERVGCSPLVGLPLRFSPDSEMSRDSCPTTPTAASQAMDTRVWKSHLVHGLFGTRRGNNPLIYHEVSKGQIQAWICPLHLECYKVRFL